MGNIIYHYCNVESFKAIIEDKILWLSSVYNLNDYKEIHWIKDKLAKKLQNSITKNNFSIYKAFEELYFKQLPNVYIGSFSKGSDLLSQWRAYANDGFGVAIGFNEDYFKNNKLIHPSEVLYDEIEQEKTIDLILQPLDDLDAKVDINSQHFKETCSNIIIEINNLSARSKNELFKEEQEVRLIHNPIIIDDKENEKYIFKDNISDMKFRSVCGNLIPYFELDINENTKNMNSIVEIIKGPKNKFIDEEVKIFLSQNGFYNVDIKNSKSSYR
ncbi:hypothetical protein LPB137_11580 [Poseidonibacter parvus]|uniref:DUF2971 domain-containing protein n=1 Tax=Poseidonibacter parvus TaxID=1850254 RepID=A0A1P8KPH5_9BACT|nr:DUF2971 domain-containing protein [Poseidonibacter parvus]APW66448.1 hypothetical protein LPB137_11580 [Poseidonibacter parvus]